jgi:hypothetical protein
MANYNVWLPGNTYFDFNDGVDITVGYKATAIGGQLLCQSFTIPNAQAGFGITYDQINPAFNITKPPKLMYTSTSDMLFVVKDSDGWLWAAPCPQQNQVKERGWSWVQFSLHTVQENVGTPPTAPASGAILAFQFNGAEGVHGDENDQEQTLSIAYLAGRTPVTASAGSLRKVILTDKNPTAHTWKIGTVEVTNATRKPVRYIGALPFGLQLNGPRNRLSVLPYRGPIVAGYQGGTPWIHANDMEKLEGMIDFMLEAQEQFRARSPDEIFGPWMHIYLQALWDCEQNGEIDTWVWDGPDGNPAWDGWQYRAFDSMGRTWYEATLTNNVIPPELMAKIVAVNTRFFDWLHGWMVENPDSPGVPNDWRPPGWTQGTPFPKDSYLDPKYTTPSAHDIGLALKGAVFCAVAGYDLVKARYVIHRLVTSLVPLQVVEDTDMHGAFTKNPDGFEVYGFEQGEVLEALALCLQHRELLSPEPIE